MSGHVVVDGSNMATEGRSKPSFAQLRDAVSAYQAEHPDQTTTVVVDATFPNRIPKGERSAFEQAIDGGELLTPPAGVVGRGDAFILQVAHKASAVVLSNDSFQEFHGEYPWLLEQGRLVGGKPVPGVGWIFVDRVPVQGPVSRKAVRDARKTGSTIRSGRVTPTDSSATAPDDGGAVAPDDSGRAAPASGGRRRTRRARPREDAASGGEDTAKDDTAKDAAPGRGSATDDGAPDRDGGTGDVADHDDGAKGAGGRRRSTRRRRGAKRSAGLAGSADGQEAPPDGSADGQEAPPDDDAAQPYNERLPFVQFVASHLPGSTVSGTVDRFSSHGAYVTVGPVQCYLPLKLMGDPAPTRARDVVKTGEERRFVVEEVDPATRGIDLALPGFGSHGGGDAGPSWSEASDVKETSVAQKRTARAGSKKKAPARKKAPAKKKAPANKRAPAKKKAPARKKASAKKKAPAKKRAPARKKAPAKKKATTRKRVPAKRAAARKRSAG